MFGKEVPYIMVELDASFTPLDNEGHFEILHPTASLYCFIILHHTTSYHT